MKQLLSAHLLLTYPYSHPAQSTVPLVISAIAGYALPAAGGGGGGGASWLYGALVKGALLPTLILTLTVSLTLTLILLILI